MRQDTTIFGFGNAGNSQAQNFNLLTLNLPGPGRYRVWGNGRHTLADGLKLVGAVALILSGGPSDTAMIGPVVVDATAASPTLSVQLNVATGASDTASCNLYAERINH